MRNVTVNEFIENKKKAISSFVEKEYILKSCILLGICDFQEKKTHENSEVFL